MQDRMTTGHHHPPAIVVTVPPRHTPPLESIPPQVSGARDYEDLAVDFIAGDRLAYIAGGSGADRTLDSNPRAFDAYSLIPAQFADLSDAGTEVELAGQRFAHPLFLAPVAFQELVHDEAELATARAAAATDSCLVASTLSSRPLEDIARCGPEQRWFQLYLQPEPGANDRLIHRARDAGYRAMVLTVDGAVQLPSQRAVRSRFRFPANIRAGNFEQHFPAASASAVGSGGDIFQVARNARVSPVAIEQLIRGCELPVFIKGILDPADARQCVEMGAAGIVVSNHGGRTLDGVVASLSMLEAVRRVVGQEYPVLFDGGIRGGIDAFKAIALGADAVLIGRLQLYALAVAGALGVAHMLKLLRQEFELAMAVCGCASPESIDRSRLAHSW